MTEKSDVRLEQRMNVVRAGVLGSNDGILTVVGVLFSVAAATTDNFILLIAGVSDLFAVALSMSAGEYASVSAQREAEKSAVEHERQFVNEQPEQARQQIADYYQEQGTTQQTASSIADELMAKGPLQTLVYAKHAITVDSYVDPWGAAIASMFSAALGGLLPLTAIYLAPTQTKYFWTILMTVVAVAITGSLSAWLGKSSMKKAVVRNIIIGLITVAIHYYVGTLF